MRKIDHVAIAVHSLDSACKQYTDILGSADWTIEEVAGQKTRVAMISIGDCRVEILEAMSEDSPVAAFIAKRGEGMHHICFQTDDLDEELGRLAAVGVRLIDKEPRIGAGGSRVAFVHPSGASGVLIELVQLRAQPEPQSE